MKNTIGNMDDSIDSRDIIERIEELQGKRDNLEDDAPALSLFDDSEEGNELRILIALQNDAEGYCPDWTCGAQLIRELYFAQAMDEMVEDCYGDQYTKDLPSWMSLSIDYEALKQDYTEVDFDGTTYLVR